MTGKCIHQHFLYFNHSSKSIWLFTHTTEPQIIANRKYNSLLVSNRGVLMLQQLKWYTTNKILMTQLSYDSDKLELLNSLTCTRVFIDQTWNCKSEQDEGCDREVRQVSTLFKHAGRSVKVFFSARDTLRVIVVEI